MDLSFHFAIKEAAFTDIEQEERDFIVGNVLSFDRTFPKSMLEYRLGPLQGMWFVPAISLDIPWIVEKWDYFVNGKDPLAPFKE